jgi:Mor family transcriptional regulator
MTRTEREQRNAKIVKLWNMGLSSSAIAERFQMSQEWVSVVLRANGIRASSEAPRQRYDCAGASFVGGRR